MRSEMRDFWRSSIGFTMDSESDYDSDDDSSLLVLIGGYYAVTYLCKEPCRTSRLTGAAYLSSFTHPRTPTESGRVSAWNPMFFRCFLSKSRKKLIRRITSCFSCRTAC